jgi:hypothetical protein
MFAPFDKHYPSFLLVSSEYNLTRMAHSSLATGEYSVLLEDHSERISKVEGTQQEILVNIAEIATKQDFIAKTLENSLNRIEKSIEKMCDSSNSCMAKREAIEDSLNEKLKPLVEERHKAIKKKKEFSGYAKKILLGALLAGSGAIATKLGTILSDLIGF